MEKFRKQPEVYRRIEWINVVLTHTLLVLMMFCVGLVVMYPIRRIAPSMPAGLLPWLCVVVSLEAMASWFLTQRKADMETSELTSILIEWVVILIVLKLILTLWRGVDRLWTEIPRWQSDFLDAFLNAEYLFFIFITASVWFLVRFFTNDLAETRGDELLGNVDIIGGYASDRSAIRRRMASVIFTIGFILVIVVALLFVDARYLSHELNISRAGLLALVFYFLFGLGLLSQVQFAALRAQWVWERIAFDPNLLKRWTAYSLLFIALISVLAFILPTGYSLGLLATLNYLLQILITLLYSIFFILMIPILWLIGLFARGGEEAPQEQQLPPPQMPPLPDTSPSAPVPWLEILKSVLFWTVFLGLVGYALYQYVRQNQALMERLRRMRLFNWLAGTWKWLKGVFHGWNEGLSAVVQAGINRLRARRDSARENIARRFINPRRLNPRQQVMFFYLAMVRRGGEQGLPRKPDQTPAEYARFLQTKLPEADEDVGALTDSFVEARYTPHEIPPDRAGAVRQVWERLKRALRDWGKVG
jgi:hypothetical protein